MKIEKINFKNSRGLNLVGVLTKPDIDDKKNIIIISHGSASNKDRPRLVKVSEKLCEAGFASLRYDTGGSGGSEDAPVTVANYTDDIKSAMKYIIDLGYSNLSLLGESLGGLSSILAYNKEIKSLVLWAPVTASKVPSILKDKQVEKDLENKGYFLYRKDEKDFKFPKQYLEERTSINQEKILSKIKCPVLIIQGTNDNTIPLEDSKKALKYLSKESRLELIEGGIHSLNNKIDEIIPLTLNWFNKYLK